MEILFGKLKLIIQFGNKKTFPYQAKCLNWIKDEFNKLSKSDKEITLKMLKGSGCEKILN
jgi:hypothetical protein